MERQLGTWLRQLEHVRWHHTVVGQRPAAFVEVAVTLSPHAATTAETAATTADDRLVQHNSSGSIQTAREVAARVGRFLTKLFREASLCRFQVVNGMLVVTALGIQPATAAAAIHLHSGNFNSNHSSHHNSTLEWWSPPTATISVSGGQASPPHHALLDPNGMSWLNHFQSWLASYNGRLKAADSQFRPPRCDCGRCWNGANGLRWRWRSPLRRAAVLPAISYIDFGPLGEKPPPAPPMDEVEDNLLAQLELCEADEFAL